MKNIILYISIILNIILIFLLFNKKPTNSDNIEVYESNRDTIIKNIDNIAIEITSNRLKYEKETTAIINNTVTDDYIFFSEYISRFDSINNR